MFPDEREKDSARVVKKRIPLTKKVLIIYSAAIVAAVLTIGFLLVVTGSLGGTSVEVPDAIKKQVKSAIYVPTRLPGNYKIDQSSFGMVEENTVLVFSAKDDLDSSLIFSEQAKPKDFDFDNFHQGNFEDPKALSDIPYKSVWGKSVDGRTALSVVTNDTWIIMVTESTLAEADLLLIAKNIRKY
jgi:hypothetical protein